jgi:hypothetical protein
MIKLLMYSALIVLIVNAFIWFIGRARKLKDANDIILDLELLKKSGKLLNND